ncbi:MAG: hypothetical protein K2F87_04500 [Muribaculaceae bacterium]|nr:hypothetical protein [Muribaculaceae bacterium]
MNATDNIISVNPALQPVGALNPEVAMGAIRSRVYAQGTVLTRRKSGRMLRRLFGPTSLNSTLSMMLLAARMIFGLWMLTETFLDVMADGFGFATIGMAFLGMMVALGIGTRVCSLTAALFTGFIALTALSEGLAPGLAGLIAAATLFFALAGPGRYSFDARLRHSIFRMLRRRQMTRLMENRFSYRAFEFAHL